MELDGINSAVVNKYGREIISGSPEVILLRVIEPVAKASNQLSIPGWDAVTFVNTIILTTLK